MISNTTGTAEPLVPIAKVLNNRFQIEEDSLPTIHSYE
jgi:glyceraldehyde-3-phosphate dehydrogenase/erythrose-4-phosphate dehydrogenase